jgi:anti-sigma factor RsiW
VTDEPTCREVVELVTEYLDGTLPADERKALERHLEGCAGCTAYIEQMRAVVAVAGAGAREPLPDELEKRLLAAYSELKRDPPP